MKKIISAVAAVMICVLVLVSCDAIGGIFRGDNPSEAASETASVSSGSSQTVSDDAVSETHTGSMNIVVLGDSIARGYGLPSPETQRFSALLGQLLDGVYTDVTVTNFGIDGQTGTQLALALESSPYGEIGSADAILISIGGNNVLGGLGALFDERFDLNANDVAAFTDYYKYLFSTAAEDKGKLAAAAAKLNELFKAANEAFESEDFKSLIDNAKTTLESDLPRIVAAIRKVNAEAKIYIQTVYNPYRNIGITLSHVETALDLDPHGEAAVAKLNEVIEGLAGELGYTVVPVHDRFSESDDKLTNAGIEIRSSSSAPINSPINFGVDPHPNAEGHRLIAQIYKEIITGGK